MRRLSLLALTVFVTAALAGSITETLEFSEDALQLETEQGYTTVDFDGAAHFDPLGAPDLPAVPCRVVIPASAAVTGFEVVDIQEHPIAGEYDVLPVQHPVPWDRDAKPRAFVEADAGLYSQNTALPVEPARLTRTGTKAGYRLAQFVVYPVRYNPVTRQLSVVTGITVRVDYETGRVPAARHTETQNIIHGQHLASLVLNRRDVRSYAPPKRTTSRGSAFLPAGDYEHVIITRNYWADSLTELRDWRTRQGWRSIIMPLESICSQYPGRDTAEMMRNFLKDADTTWGTIYAFIVRDDYPAHQYRVARAYGYNLFSDMYFSDLDGTWDYNNNGTFGEVADSVDGLADIFVGMITLNGFTELNKYLDKVFRYEFTPDTAVDWVAKSLLPNGVTFSNEYNDSIANATPTPPWFDLKMYMSGGMITPTPARFADSLESGYGITSVIAHGSPDLFDIGGDVTSPLMNALTNTNRLNFITAVSCNVGEWDQGTTNGDCIAENMAFHAPNGFIGVCMNYESGWINVAELYNFSICYGAVGFRTDRRVCQAEALSYGKDYWNVFLEDSGKWRMEAFERNLFGAPAVPLWTAEPFAAQVTAPGAINIGTGIAVNIGVTDANDAPVDSALVCLMKGTETFARGWTDATGNITLLVSPLTPGQLQLTITSANNLPYLDSIPVVSSSRFVAYLRSTVVDTAGGNGDGIINPGETVQLPTWVKNFGDSTAVGVTGRLITHAAGVTITDSVVSFGTIAGGDSAYQEPGFEMAVTAGLPNGYAIPCSVVCRDANDSTWVSYATFHVGAPALVFVDKMVDDQNSSQPNGRLDPGETAELEVTIRNSGLGHGYNVHAVLRSTDARLTVPDSLADYGTVMAGSTGVNTGDHFTLTAAASIPMETTILCSLDIYGDAGYFSQAEFDLVIGEVRQIDPIADGPRQPALYWAYDDGDSLYSEAPTFGWVEVSGVGTHLDLSDDDVEQVNLPGAFGPFVFYGQSYSQLSICGNGFVAPGYETYTSWTNQELPYSSAPPMLAANWDDLYPPTGGGVWYYHDAANHRFVVEWDSVAYYSPRDVFDKFEIVIYDTSMAAPDGNSVFTYQYLTANRYSSSTVGEQDQTKTIFIQHVYDGAYDRGALPLGEGRAIKITTVQPMTGVSGPARTAELGRRLVVAPNPFHRSAQVRWSLSRDAVVDMKVFDATGRAVRTLVSGPARQGSYTTAWDGTDDAGRSLAHGIYFVRLRTPEATVKVKTVLTR